MKNEKNTQRPQLNTKKHGFFSSLDKNIRVHPICVNLRSSSCFCEAKSSGRPFFPLLALVAMLALPQCADTKGFLTDDDEDITSLTSPIYLWTSTPNYTGNLGGVSGADNICNEPAEISAAMLPSGRIYMHRAIIVDDTSELPEAFTIPNKGDREVQRPNGTKIVDNYNAMLRGEIGSADYLDESIIGGGDRYWTGLDLDNSGGVPTTGVDASYVSGTDNCLNWTTDISATGFYGDGSEKNHKAFKSLGNVRCTSPRSLLCVSH